MRSIPYLKKYGNGKRHHDPPVLSLKRLLCFRESVWGELRVVVERQERARAAARAKTPSAEPVVLEPAAADVEEQPQHPTLCLDLDIRVCEWWELQRWNEISDECSIWGDPSPETTRVAAELMAGQKDGHMRA